jgi:hypothetical protein
MIPSLEPPPSPSETVRRLPIDLIGSLVAAVVVFVVYLRTMYPGIFGVGDATKFAFVGRILGTPHAPGYPLYVMVSHLFSYLPWGTLAHRMNGMSAFFGAVAVGLVYAAARLIGAGPLAAFAGALSLGFGSSYWSRAIYAKTYTLNAAIVALGLVLLVRWGRTRRRSHLYSAIAVFALSVGNHLIVVSLVPALMVYAIAVDRKQALSWRTIAFTIVAVAASFCQYLLILVRTLQHAPYLEARASNLHELIEVITVRRWSQEIGAYTGGALLTVRVPIIAGLVINELTIVGLLLSLLGLAVLLRRRWREALLCSLAALGVLALTATMSSNEDQGFLLPAFVLLWILAAAGLDWIVSGILAWRRRGGTFAPVGSAAALACASAMPMLLLVDNYAINDHHDRTYEIRYFNALFDMLPARAAVVDDRYPIDMMLQYKLLGEDAAHGRTIRIVPPDHAAVDAMLSQGFQVFAFGEGRATLQMLGYQFTPVTLKESDLSSYLAAVPAGWTVAFASTPAAAPFLREGRGGWQRIGADGDALFARRQSVAAAVVGVAGKPGAARDAGQLSASVSIPKDSAIGGSGVSAVVPIDASADAATARVTINGTERARSDGGAVIAIVDRSGRATATVLDTHDNLRVPLDMAPLPLYRLSAASACRDIGNTGWQDLSMLGNDGTLAVRIDNYRPFLARALFYLAGSEAAHAQLSEVSGVGTPAISTQTFELSSPSGRAALTEAVARDQAHLPAAFSGVKVVSRVELAVNDKGAFSSARVGFGFVPSAVYGRTTVDLSNPRRATVCGRQDVSAATRH